MLECVDSSYLSILVHVSGILGFWSHLDAIWSIFWAGTYFLRAADTPPAGRKHAAEQTLLSGRLSLYLNPLLATFLASYSLPIRPSRREKEGGDVFGAVLHDFPRRFREDSEKSKIGAALSSLLFFFSMTSFVYLFCFFSLAMSE